jgi:hypothetical protein
VDSRGKVVEVIRSPAGKLDEALEDESEVAENDIASEAWLPSWLPPDAGLEATG